MELRPAEVTWVLKQQIREFGKLGAVVTTAVPLAEVDRVALRGVIEGCGGPNVALEFQVNPKLIGGIVVRIGNRQFDDSLDTKLKTLKTLMKEAP